MKIIFSILVLFSVDAALANDGGQAAIKVSEIKMREYEIKQGQRVEKRRISNPDFKIFIKGEEAWKLQQILPSVVSVLTYRMSTSEKAQFDKTFKALGIYNKGSTGVTSKLLNIDCNDGDLETDAQGRATIKPRGESHCEIMITAEADPEDMLGDIQKFEPPVCFQ